MRPSLQLIKFWPSRAPGKGVYGGAKIFCLTIRSARSVCVFLSAFFIETLHFLFFHYLCLCHLSVQLIELHTVYRMSAFVGGGGGIDPWGNTGITVWGRETKTVGVQPPPPTHPHGNSNTAAPSMSERWFLAAVTQFLGPIL